MLNVGCYRYDTTQALFDGTVGFPGVEARFESAPVISDIFERMVRHREFDVAELGLTFYLRTLDLDDPPFVAVPVFPNRVFRHSCVFVNKASGITGPADLVGKTIGEFALYGQDSGVWAKGILSDEYGFDPAKNRWVIGGLDRPMAPFDFVPCPVPDGLDVRPAPAGKALGPMLAAGEIDALFSANVPECVLAGAPGVTRLFPDFEPIERDYYRRTGVFPMMHTVVLRARHAEHARAVYDGFLAARNVAMDRYRDSRKLYEVTTMVPWMNALVEENERLFPDDWWPYGVAANRTAVDTFLRYHHEQGLSPRGLTVEDLFVRELLDS